MDSLFDQNAETSRRKTGEPAKSHAWKAKGCLPAWRTYRAPPANEKPPRPVLAGAAVKATFSTETTLPPHTRKNKAPATS